MVTSARSTLAISVLALAISASGASGQQNEITTQEAEAYFRQLQQEATEIVGQQDFGLGSALAVLIFLFIAVIASVITVRLRAREIQI